MRKQTKNRRPHSIHSAHSNFAEKSNKALASERHLDGRRSAALIETRLVDTASQAFIGFAIDQAEVHRGRCAPARVAPGEGKGRSRSP